VGHRPRRRQPSHLCHQERTLGNDSKAVCQLLQDHRDHAFVAWLPRYSPELNLIEGLWGYLKRSALNNYFYGEIESLEAAIHQAFTELQQHPETALSLAYKNNTNLRKTA
jgi:transposase